MMQLKRVVPLTFALSLLFLSTGSAHPGHAGVHLEYVASISGNVLLGFVILSFLGWTLRGWFSR